MSSLSAVIDTGWLMVVARHIIPFLFMIRVGLGFVPSGHNPWWFVVCQTQGSSTCSVMHGPRRQICCRLDAVVAMSSLAWLGQIPHQFH
jgi:hypothetical protein